MILRSSLLRFGRRARAVLALGFAAGAAGASAADRPPAATMVRPPETGVLLLPALDATADSEHMQGPRQFAIRRVAEGEFIARQFKVMGEAMAARAASADPPVDLACLSARNAENLNLLARRMRADWVVNLVVESVTMDSSLGPNSDGGFKIHSRVRLQVWDARHRHWLVDRSFTDDSRGDGSPIMVFKESLGAAVSGALTSVLGAYPKIVPITHSGAVVDYLAGQTAPVVGDPGHEFKGLGAR